MKTAAVIGKMIELSEGNLKDINHLIKVHGFARLIGELEALEDDEKERLEVAAAVHDISCEFCRRKYGHCSGKVQEEESPTMVRAFLEDFHYSTKFVDRIAWIVGHHHTYEGVEGADYQILLEADFLVNACEMSLSNEALREMYEKVFRTRSGKKLLQDMYPAAWK